MQNNRTLGQGQEFFLHIDIDSHISTFHENYPGFVLKITRSQGGKAPWLRVRRLPPVWLQQFGWQGGSGNQALIQAG
jgi:hypothetical protein